MTHPFPTRRSSDPPSQDLISESAMNLQELKSKSPTDLLAFAEELQIENANTLRKQDMMFAILKQLADKEVEITGVGVLEVLQDGFGFLRSAEAHYLARSEERRVGKACVGTGRSRWSQDN